MVHSAEWTPAMWRHFNAATRQNQKLALLRRYGYGVPDFQRAILSALNDLTLIVEDELQPFWLDEGADRVKTKHMKLHLLPWPKHQLQDLGETEVQLRITLSYFVEPNPGERGWTRRHRYQSHSLRFAVKRSLEPLDDFRSRINRAVLAEEQDMPQPDTGTDDWLLGSIRDTGSVHSDYWRGTGVELADREAIAVYPVGGWWKEKPALRRFDRKVRYALIVSIRAVTAAIDIYTPVATAVAATIPIQT